MLSVASGTISTLCWFAELSSGRERCRSTRTCDGHRGSDLGGWLACSALLSWYLAHFANYDATYGSLSAAIGLMMWMWISVIVILLGAQLNSEIEHQAAHDSPVGNEKPLGARGAVIADTVGQAEAA
jgi:Virulence factor BrkB